MVPPELSSSIDEEETTRLDKKETVKVILLYCFFKLFQFMSVVNVFLCYIVVKFKVFFHLNPAGGAICLP